MCITTKPNEKNRMEDDYNALLCENTIHVVKTNVPMKAL